MMVLLGVDSQFAHCDVPIQAFLDEYPNLLPKKFARSVNHLIPVRLSWSMVIKWLIFKSNCGWSCLLSWISYRNTDFDQWWISCFPIFRRLCCIVWLAAACTYLHHCNQLHLSGHEFEYQTLKVKSGKSDNKNSSKFMTVKFRFFGDIEKMIGRMNIVAKVYFSMMWFVGSPVMILFIGKTFNILKCGC